MSWLLGLLIFVFGYVTCKTFYFLSASRISVRLLRSAQLVYLSVMIKSLENLSYSREIALEHMLRTERKSPEISSFEYKFDEEVRMIKDRAITQLINQHPRLFRDTIEFTDWNSSMAFLTKYKGSILSFWRNSDQKN